MKAIKLLVACAATLLFASCLQMEEPASVEALRNAKAELLTAEAQYRQAETAYLNAQTAYQQALADNQVLLNKMEELNLKKLTAQTESEILALEQEMEELKLDHQVLLLGKKFELAQAEQEYAEALAALAEQAKGISDYEQEVLDSYVEKLADLKVSLANAQDAYESAVIMNMEAQYSFDFDYEVYKAYFLAEVTAAQNELELATEFQELVAGLTGSDHLVAIEKLKKEIEAEEAKIKKLEDEITLYTNNEKADLNEQIDELNNRTAENTAKIDDLRLQQKHLFMDNEAYYKLTLSVPEILASELHSWFNYNYYEGEKYLDYVTGFVLNQDSGTWGTLNKTVTIQFDFKDNSANTLSSCQSALENGPMASLLQALVNEYEPYKDGINDPDAQVVARANYYSTLLGQLNKFKELVKNAKTDSDNIEEEIKKIDATQLQVDLEKSALKLKLSKVDVDVATKQKNIDDMKDALEYVKSLKGAYEGFMLGTEVSYPKIMQVAITEKQDIYYYYYDEYGNLIYYDESHSEITGGPYETTLGNMNINNTWYIEYETRQLTSIELLEEWAEVADFMLAFATAGVTKAQGMYDEYCTAENPLVVAQKQVVVNAQLDMAVAQKQYEFYKAQFELYTKLFNDYFASVMETEGTTTPPAEGTTPEDELA